MSAGNYRLYNSGTPTSFHTSFCMKSERFCTFFLFAPKLIRFSTDRELDSIVTLLASLPMATTLILTLSLMGEISQPRRAAMVKWSSSHLMLLKRVRDWNTCFTAVYTRLALRGNSSVSFCILHLFYFCLSICGYTQSLCELVQTSAVFLGNIAIAGIVLIHLQIFLLVICKLRF